NTGTTADSRLLNKGDTGFIWIINYGEYGSVNDAYESNVRLNVYPNPAEGRVYVELPGSGSAGILRVVNNLGAELYAVSTGGNMQLAEINTSSWHVGMYHIMFTGVDGGTAFSSFIIR